LSASAAPPTTITTARPGPDARWLRTDCLDTLEGRAERERERERGRWQAGHCEREMGVRCGMGGQGLHAT
jgi:hypothetical protein